MLETSENLWIRFIFIASFLELSQFSSLGRKPKLVLFQTCRMPMVHLDGVLQKLYSGLSGGGVPQKCGRSFLQKKIPDFTKK